MNNKELSIKQLKTKKQINICFCHNLNCSNIKDIHQQVLKNLKKDHGVKIELEAMENIDITGIQLIEAIKTHCNKNNTEFEFSFDLSESNQELLRKTGFVWTTQ